jgi:hypothetical protein
MFLWKERNKTQTDAAVVPLSFGGEKHYRNAITICLGVPAFND